MAVGVSVFGIDGAGQRVYDLVGEGLQPLVAVQELRRLPVHLVLQGILQMLEVQDAVDALHGHLHDEGLGDEVHGARFKEDGFGIGAGVRSQEDHGQVLAAVDVPDMLQDLDAIHFRHVEIQQHQIGTLPFDFPQGFRA